jgi:hypothetical protein
VKLQLDSAANVVCPITGLEVDIDLVSSSGQESTLVNGQGGAAVTCSVGASSFNANVCLGGAPCFNFSGSIPSTATGCSGSSTCTITGVQATMTAAGINGIVDSYSSSEPNAATCTLIVSSLTSGLFQGTISCQSLLSASAPQTYGCKILSGTSFLFTNCSGG